MISHETFLDAIILLQSGRTWTQGQLLTKLGVSAATLVLWKRIWIRKKCIRIAFWSRSGNNYVPHWEWGHYETSAPRPQTGGTVRQRRYRAKKQLEQLRANQLSKGMMNGKS